MAIQLALDKCRSAALVRIVAFLIAIHMCVPVIRAQRLADLRIPERLPQGSTLVIGFLGGYERWNDEHRSVRRLALKLGEQPGVYAVTISNHHRRVARQLIWKVLDTNRNGKIDDTERASARIILYGQSWGGAAAIALARDLEHFGIPVLLTVQVDSVGLNDRVVPVNVRRAVNFYQHDPFTIEGAEQIRAADPAKTKILGNFRSSYRERFKDESNSSWVRSNLGGSHARMEMDPAIWDKVERYIDQAIERR